MLQGLESPCSVFSFCPLKAYMKFVISENPYTQFALAHNSNFQLKEGEKEKIWEKASRFGRNPLVHSLLEFFVKEEYYKFNSIEELDLPATDKDKELFDIICAKGYFHISFERVTETRNDFPFISAKLKIVTPPGNMFGYQSNEGMVFQLQTMGQSRSAHGLNHQNKKNIIFPECFFWATAKHRAIVSNDLSGEHESYDCSLTVTYQPPSID